MNVISKIIFVVLINLPFLSCASTMQEQAMEFIEQLQPESYFSEPQQIALAEAVAENDTVKIQKALDNGAKVDQVGRAGMTPLFWAIVKQSFEAFHFLLEAGANPNVVVTLPEEASEKRVGAMALAARLKDSKYLEALLEHGGNANAIINEWDQPVIYQAIMHRNLDNVKLLLKYGADINHQDKSGATPMLDAVTARQFVIALYLLHAGADPKIETNSGYSSIDFISKYGSGGIDKRTNDLTAYTKFVQELKNRGLLEEMPPRVR